MANSEGIDTLPVTQTQLSHYTQDLESQPVEPLCYGRLLGKLVKTKTLDISNSEYRVGRDDNQCDLILNESLLDKRALLHRVSKVHFAIQKDLNDLSSPTFITDASRNGTFVNGRLIGTRKRMVLKHLDVISIINPHVKAFVYHDLFQYATPEVKAKELRDNYHIGKRLGSGACGTVYLLHHTVSCQPFAMKHVIKDQISESTRPKFLNDPMRVMNEVNIMKNLNHPCVIKMHDIVDKPDSVYMVLEYMEGGDLLTRIISNKHLTEKTAKLFFLQMCHAVKYLHEQGITHRDLKPDNILLQDDQEYTLLKVSDFGLSKFVRKNSVMRTLCGTPLYVAPEVLKTSGKGAYTRKVDIWSLGVVLFTMLSGTLPFSDEYGTPAVEQIKRGKFAMRHPAWRKVSSMAKKLIFDILNVNPTARPSIDTLLASTWLRDEEVICEAERLMQVPLRAGKVPVPLVSRTARNTPSDVENNNAGRQMEPPSKRKKL
ncbi:ovarian-specific serine/threonine-protein kinase Lok isoform X2 [Anopheles ziemanni]|uniref:ovarian-specific serine/threonine-protein kinase Lok isoform X2 n=1 Tax=Anopheles coustani TaxID=139045 RepID=UPI002657FD63|nr:ovarian-specific serine/threonine-protein kinase Lok isoform X2 [Anopheles coustani]XP_058174163.1 ovarian-specific serine/threonine-protein kinase Lok isoform X2 [Anopheles ziemanni]